MSQIDMIDVIRQSSPKKGGLTRETKKSPGISRRFFWRPMLALHQGVEVG